MGGLFSSEEQQILDKVKCMKNVGMTEQQIANQFSSQKLTENEEQKKKKITRFTRSK